MADTTKIDEILGRALRDRQFRVSLVNDPKAAAKEVGLTEQEIQLITGGLAIGNSLLNPGSVAFCTAKTCNEKGDARTFPGGTVITPVATGAPGAGKGGAGGG